MKASKFFKLKTSWEKKEKSIVQESIQEVKEEVVEKPTTVTKTVKKKINEQPTE